MREDKALAKPAAQSPFGLLRQMTSELDRMFDDPWKLQWPVIHLARDTQWAPKIEVLEKDQKLVTRVDLPGVKKEDVSVEVTDGQLILSGERKVEKEETTHNVYRSECEYGHFYRAVPLPEGVKADDVKATFANGVLEVSVPLPVPAQPNGKKIEITDGAKAA
jgi:HSP20 family protein